MGTMTKRDAWHGMATGLLLAASGAASSAPVDVMVNVIGNDGGTCRARFITPGAGQSGGNQCGQGQMNGEACGRPGDTVTWRFIGNTDPGSSRIIFPDSGVACSGFDGTRCTLSDTEGQYKYDFEYRFPDGSSCYVDPYIVIRR